MEMNVLKLCVLIWINLRNIVLAKKKKMPKYMYTKIVVSDFKHTEKLFPWLYVCQKSIKESVGMMKYSG